MKYQLIERSIALALNDVVTLETLIRKRLIQLKQRIRDSNSLSYESIQEVCYSIDKAVTEILSNVTL
jgi:hypothetical protein